MTRLEHSTLLGVISPDSAPKIYTDKVSITQKFSQNPHKKMLGSSPHSSSLFYTKSAHPAPQYGINSQSSHRYDPQFSNRGCVNIELHVCI